MIKKIIKKLPILVYYFMRFSILVALGFSLWRRHWLTALATVGILFLIFLPSFIKKRFKVYIPFEFEIFASFSIYMAVFLGDFNKYYNKFWWWDIYLHFSFGILFGIIGFMVVYLLSSHEKTKTKLPSILVCIFALSFSVSFGVLWEFFEYTMDTVFGVNMQRSGLPDTMLDLLLDFLGGGIVSLAGFLWLKNRLRFYIFDRAVEKFVKHNQKFAEK